MQPPHGFTLPPSGKDDDERPQRKRSRQQREPVQLAKDDVIIGRGTQWSDNPGNKRFYDIVDACAPVFVGAGSKRGKSCVVHQIFDAISANGRFLKRDPTSAQFHVISDVEARQKISHAIRYRWRKRRGSAMSSRSDTPSNDDNRGSGTDDEFKQNSTYVEQHPVLQDELFTEEEIRSVLGHPSEYGLEEDAFGSDRLLSISPLHFEGPDSSNRKQH